VKYPLLPLLKKKFFGPVVAVLRVKGFPEAIAVANNTNYALTGGLYSRTPTHIQVAQEQFEVGNLYIIATSQVRSYPEPFGGFKLSGVGSRQEDQTTCYNF